MVFEIFSPFLFEWVHRKVNARVQRRVGPPFLQPVYDFLKLLGKEIIIPHGANIFFVIAPVLLFALSLLMVLVAIHRAQSAVLLLLILFAVDVFLRTLLAYSVKSPFTMQGLSRLGAMKMALDPAFPLAFLAPAFLFGFDMSWPVVAMVFFPIAFAVTLAELEMPPFDIPTARWEIAGGWKAELSGGLLAAVNYAEYAKAVALSALLASFFGPSHFLLKTLLVFVAMNLVSVSLPRFALNKAVKYLTALNILALMEVIISLSMAF